MGRKKYVIDEDAFYNQREDEEIDEKKPQKYDSYKNEPNLARKLGLEDDSAPEKPKEANKKKSKEDLEKEKEIDEVRQIIEKDTGFNKYIKEVDLLGLDIEAEPKKNSQPISTRLSRRNEHRPAQH